MSAQVAELHAPGTRKPARIESLLTRTLQAEASDLHLAVNTSPWLRVHGALTPMPGTREMPANFIASVLQEMVSDEEWKKFLREKRLDFSYATDESRYRAHFGLSNGAPMAVFRAIPNTVPDFNNLGLPEIVRSFNELESGLVIFCGITGSGKSSSLASLVKERKDKYAQKIITLENPVEFLHTHGRSMIVQREIGKDVDHFAIGIEDAMREDPDVILVGEMRDAETMSAAISAATSGHLVFSTIHAESTADVPTRILDSIPEGRINEVRAQLSRSLRGIVYQKLLPKKGGQGRALAAEVMKVNKPIANMIRQNKLEGIAGQLNNAESGSIPFEVSLVNLVADGVVNESTAKRAEITEGSYDRQKTAGRR